MIRHNGGPPLTVDIPEAFQELFVPARYKVYHGGRGGAKSWAFARALVALAYTRKLRILCTREYQSSIADSVHRLISDQIGLMGLQTHFEILKSTIVSSVGSEFLFKGLARNVDEIKSTEGVDIAWCEEAQRTTARSLEILIPTIRKDNSGVSGTGDAELWFSFNPEDVDAPVYGFVKTNPPDSIVRHVGWQDNPHFPTVLDKERRYMLETDPEAYEHVWGGQPRKVSDAVIFKNRITIHTFETPNDPAPRFFHGADFGFANDPTALTRSYVTKEPDGEHLWIDYEAFGYGVEIDDTPALFEKIPTARSWPIKGDNSRPETISYLRRQGFNIASAEKWPGCVEDGIAHLKGFRLIHIHERCPQMAQEARLYSYKVDKLTRQVLPIIVDAHNHGWDSQRYALDGYILKRGGLGVWGKL